MKKPTLQTIFSIYAADKKGLIGQILVYFNRKNFAVSSLNVARTDIRDLVLVTLEAVVPEKELRPFVERLKKVIEVYAVQTYAGCLKKTGFYRMAVLNETLWGIMHRYGAVLSSLGEQSVVISKTGSDDDLEELYRRLEGPHLLGFCKSGLIVDQSLSPLAELG
jgi:acetolactate synthase-1/3 small subunit